MIAAIRTRLDEREEGFTLIELLVVVIIIGILAAIAIPTFLSQRERGWQAELTSVVRNTALELEAEATQNGGQYPITLDGQGVADAFIATDDDSPVTVVYTRTGDAAASGGFTLVGAHADLEANVGDHNVTYDTSLGGIQDYEETETATP